MSCMAARALSPCGRERPEVYRYLPLEYIREDPVCSTRSLEDAAVPGFGPESGFCGKYRQPGGYIGYTLFHLPFKKDRLF